MMFDAIVDKHSFVGDRRQWQGTALAPPPEKCKGYRLTSITALSFPQKEPKS